MISSQLQEIINFTKSSIFAQQNKSENLKLKKMKRKLLTLFAAIGLLNSVNAQVSAYAFTQSTGTYTPITGGTVLGDTTSDDEVFVSTSVPLGGSTTTGVGLPIGFSFTYNGIVFDRLAVNNNGWISLGQSSLTPSVDAASSSGYSPISSTSTITPTLLRNRIGGLCFDLEGQGGSELMLATIGTTPNRVCVIQWKKYNRFGGTGNNYNFQIRLNETSNTVSIVYGTMTNGTAPYSPQVGLGGAASTDFNNRTSTTSWSATTAGTTNNATCALSATIFPASGLTFTWTQPTGCTGTPTAGTASAPAGACSGVAFDLALTGYSTGTSGITFKWQSSPTGVSGSFTDIVGGTTSTFATTQTATTYYQCIVTCTASSLSATSNTVTVTMNTTLNCYCASNATSTSDEEILNVTIGSLNNSSTCTTTGGTGSTLNEYSNYTAISAPNLPRTANMSFSVQVGSCGGSYGNVTKIFIDYNQNGSFIDAGETAYASTSYTIGAHFETGSISIPLTATLGNTRMRIITQETSSASSINACGTYSWGETEDYTVNIDVVPPACTGTPVAGTASSSVDSTCGTNFDLSLSGYSLASGLTFQWQSSSSGAVGSYTNIVGATSYSFSTMQSATTYYQCIVTCTSSTLTATSNAITVYQMALADCLCTPVHSGACSTTDNIDSVSIVGTSLMNYGTGCTGVNGLAYTKYPATGNTTTTLIAGTTYTLRVTTKTSNIVSVWFDYNHNGLFEGTEWKQVCLTSVANVPNNVSITIPVNALNGQTSIRIRSRLANNTNDSLSSCLSFGSGETEDYSVNITGGTVGISDYSVSNLQVYPNPTTGDLNINFITESNTLNVKLMNVEGQLIYTENVEHFSGKYSSKINIGEQAKGIYFLQITSDNKVTTKKVVLY